ncbi:MAG: hypothetical protein F4213_11960 [Boseongicola sp. SB0677_bin_26]|nr:hypothetical protein [Boseongicola sp. SB0665_bin_10]MYG26720.1 hypothetical protein [Boseongicola sp. SB0677_bin_26]
MTIRELLVAASILLSASASVHGQSDSTCAAYMEADAMIHASPGWHKMVDSINFLDAHSIASRAILDTLGAPAEVGDFNSAAERQRRAYMRAYKGPVSDHAGVMYELLLRDRRACRLKRFPLVGPGVTLKPVREWTSRDHGAFLRFVRSGQRR